MATIKTCPKCGCQTDWCPDCGSCEPLCDFVYKYECGFSECNWEKRVYVGDADYPDGVDLANASR